MLVGGRKAFGLVRAIKVNLRPDEWLGATSIRGAMAEHWPCPVSRRAGKKEDSAALGLRDLGTWKVGAVTGTLRVTSSWSTTLARCIWGSCMVLLRAVTKTHFAMQLILCGLRVHLPFDQWIGQVQVQEPFETAFDGG